MGGPDGVAGLLPLDEIVSDVQCERERHGHDSGEPRPQECVVVALREEVPTAPVPPIPALNHRN